MSEKNDLLEENTQETSQVEKKSFFKKSVERLVTQPEEIRTRTLADGTTSVEPFSYTPLIFLVLFLVSLISYFVTIAKYFSNSRNSLWGLILDFGNFFEILGLMIKQFDFSYSVNVIQPLIDTVQMSILGSVLGAVLALPAALLASSNINKNTTLLSIVRLLLSVLRTFPVLVYAIFLALIFKYGLLPGSMAITIFTFAIMSKMLYEKIETIDMSAYTAIEATGATKVRSFFTAVIPQIMGTYLSLSLYSFEINIRYAAILGYVGAGGIGFILDDRMIQGRDGGYGDALVILVFLFLTVVTIESLSRYIRRRLT